MSELSNTIKQICDEKGLSLDAVLGTIESALAAAYRKDFGQKNQNIKVKFNIDTGNSEVFDIKTVVEDMPEEDEDTQSSEGTEIKEGKKGKAEKTKDETPKNAKERQVDINNDNASAEGEDEERKFNPKTEIQISDAKLIKKSSKIGDEIKTKLDVPADYGRMAAQTAKQVIIQRLREAERDMIFSEFKEKEHEVISGVIQRREGRIVLIDLGKTVGILPGEEQIYNEHYKPGARIKVYVKDVNIGSKGPEIILSRTSDEILKKVFYLEIPEISNGLVDLKFVAREAGSRSKVAVFATSDNIDPIGSCVGQRGARIQTIINELGGEKVDIIEYDETPEKFIANALSPAKILNIDIDEKKKEATVVVTPDQLSLAIGKGGQNVRLAARLTGWKIDIVEQAPTDVKETPKDAKEDGGEDKKEKKDKKSEGKKDVPQPAAQGRDADSHVGKKEDKKKDEKIKKEKKVGDKKDDLPKDAKKTLKDEKNKSDKKEKDKKEIKKTKEKNDE